jgi:hypothetical protein
MTKHYGATGAACVWLSLNLAYVIFEIPVMHLRLLPKEKWRWYGQDFVFPLLTCILVTGIGRILVKNAISSFMMIIYLLNISVVTLVITSLITPVIRSKLFRQWNMFIKSKFI